MGLYNLVHGVNPDSGILLVFVDIAPLYSKDKAEAAEIDLSQFKFRFPPRFRNISLREREGKYIVELYMRQGGGNRECCRNWQPKEYGEKNFEDNKYYSDFCFCGDCNINIEVKTLEDCKKFCQENSDYERYNKSLHEHKYFLEDKDDDWDTTYNTIRFDVTKHPDILLVLKELKMEVQPKFEELHTPESWKRRAEEIGSDLKHGREVPKGIQSLADNLKEYGDKVADTVAEEENAPEDI